MLLQRDYSLELLFNRSIFFLERKNMKCPFCLEFENPKSFKEIVPLWPYDDRILVRNKLAMAFPGLGPIVPHTPYVLVIPKSCQPSFLHTKNNERSAMFDVLDELLDNESMFPCKYALVFEHGGIVGNSGCKCIDHCHLHVMNIAGAWARLPEMLKKYHRDEAYSIDTNTVVGANSYLFAGYYQSKSRIIIGRLATIKNCREPQFFRALIGQITGYEFDYHREENLKTMIEVYEQVISKK